MDYLNTSRPDFRASVSKMLFGFFGVLAAILFLPKTIKFFLRKFLFGIIGEVIAVVIAGLLTEKAAESVAREHREDAMPGHPGERPQPYRTGPSNLSSGR